MTAMVTHPHKHRNVIIDDITAPQTTYLTTSITTPSSGQNVLAGHHGFTHSQTLFQLVSTLQVFDLSFNAVDQGWGGN